MKRHARDSRDSELQKYRKTGRGQIRYIYVISGLWAAYQDVISGHEARREKMGWLARAVLFSTQNRYYSPAEFLGYRIISHHWRCTDVHSGLGIYQTDS